MSTSLHVSYWHLLHPSHDSPTEFHQSLAHLSADDLGRLQALRQDLLYQGIIGRYPAKDSSQPGRLIILLSADDPARDVPNRDRVDAYNQPLEVIVAVDGQHRSSHEETMLLKDMALGQRIGQMLDPANPNCTVETEEYTTALRNSSNLLYGQRNFTNDQFLPQISNDF